MCVICSSFTFIMICFLHVNNFCVIFSSIKLQGFNFYHHLRGSNSKKEIIIKINNNNKKTGAWLPQGMQKDQKMMTYNRMFLYYYDYMGLVSHKGDPSK